MSESISNDLDEPFPKKIKSSPVEGATEIIHANDGPAELATQISPSSEIKTISKRQLKKQAKLAQWEEIKKLKRQKEREKYKQKRQEAIEKGLPTRTGPSRKELKRRKAGLSANPLKVAIDLDYDDLMSDRDISKCVKQLLRIYTINRRSSEPGKLFFTGVKDKGRIHESLEKNDGYQHWDVEWHFKPYHDVLEKDKIVYLSSDSDNVLSELEQDVVYVIGGLVDHNHHKGLCHSRAESLGVRTARLPLNEHVDMKTRTVLSTYHVFEILLRLSEGKPWTEAILQTIPMRKGAKPKAPPQEDEVTSSSAVTKGGDEVEESETS